MCTFQNARRNSRAMGSRMTGPMIAPVYRRYSIIYFVMSSRSIALSRLTHDETLDRMRLHDRLEPIDQAAGQMLPECIGQRRMVGPRELQVVALGVLRIRSIDAENQRMTRDVGVIGCPAMNGERRADRDVAPLRQFALGSRLVPPIQLLGREHPVGEVILSVPLRSDGYLERTHLGCDVNGRQVEGQRVQSSPAECRLWRGKVSMPRLVHRSSERDIKADLDDLVVAAEDRLTYRCHPRVHYQIDEPSQPLGMHFDVVPLGSAAHRAARALQRVFEQRFDIGPELLDPGLRERALHRGNAVAVQCTHDARGIEFVHDRDPARQCATGSQQMRAGAWLARGAIEPDVVNRDMHHGRGDTRINSADSFGSTTALMAELCCAAAPAGSAMLSRPCCAFPDIHALATKLEDHRWRAGVSASR